MDDLIPIDAELVRELKQCGKIREANKLIKAHQDSLVKNRVQGMKEFLRQDTRCTLATLVKANNLIPSV